MKSTDVLIKWTGSKRIQSKYILEHYPSEINTYYEPFIGGGSMLFSLMSEKRIKVNNIECSDLNAPLIEVWKIIQNNPKEITDSYSKLWNELSIKGDDFYYELRSEFNEDQDPNKFYFLLRCGRNGLIRYNKKGHFTTSRHYGRPPMAPERVERVALRWHDLMKTVNLKFLVRDYSEVESSKNDLIYLDPPYKISAARTIMYFGEIKFDRLYDWMRTQKGKYLLSLNGMKGDKDMTLDVPKDIYDTHIFIDAGLASFSLLQGNRVQIKDSLYIRV